jgi:hypothetical protein
MHDWPPGWLPDFDRIVCRRRELSTRDVLVRLDCNGRVGSAHIRPRRRTLARALVATVLVGVVVGDSRGSDDWLRLPHAALVSTLVTNVSSWHV